MFQTYIKELNKQFQTGNAREHSYRGALETLLNKIIDDPTVTVTNEPARIVNVGAPDYSVSRNGVPIGYIEAKDIGKSLDNKEYQEQFDRYKGAFNNLIFTDYLNFWLYRDGALVSKVALAGIEGDKIISFGGKNCQVLVDTVKDFVTYQGQKITNPPQLAKIMAGKARLLKDVIERALLEADKNTLHDQLDLIQKTLIHDITPQSFADIYAQTIAYGLFAARLHDKTPDDFSRQEAVFLIPKTNPFLRGLFNYISGAECDDRIAWIIDSLANAFLATDLEKLLEGFSKNIGLDNPIIHFYETFLTEYDSEVRKARGVWYTPKPIVEFIVKACDHVLKTDFGIIDGLADETKLEGSDVHKVQILDPATGTGTFLAEVIKQIKENYWGGGWSRYVENSLIPRLNGFELLMASYAMAHLQLDLHLLETGYVPTATENQKRFNVFLTNTLEEHFHDFDFIFAPYLANESREADRVKRDVPVMCVIGNPPYAVSSSNKGEWITELIKTYKQGLNERKINLDDDYVKFIRYGQHHIDKTGEGILAFITNNSFLDGPTYRQMRKSLLESFDKIYILDLHGNARKRETCPDGSPDQNVFEIMQGVSINIFVKYPKDKRKTDLATVYHHDLYGTRDVKFDNLRKETLATTPWKQLNLSEPYYFFVPKDFEGLEAYENGFKVTECFPVYNSGIGTQQDTITIHFTKESLQELRQDFLNLDQKTIRNRYPIKEGRNWKLVSAIDDLRSNDIPKAVSYRPFDTRWTYLSNKSNQFLAWPRTDVMRHLIKSNYGLVFERGFVTKTFQAVFITNTPSDGHCIGPWSYMSPLYLYNDDNTAVIQPNLNPDIIQKLESCLGIPFKDIPFQNSPDNSRFTALDLFDYIYAVLHSPDYRERYKEFLKIDFPRIPYPGSQESFRDLISHGTRLRNTHLLSDPSLDNRIIQIHGDAEMIIDKITHTIAPSGESVTVHINKDISISNIPITAWDFPIGGYIPAQKWLKDRKGRVLSRTDVIHYNKMINALALTHKIMESIKTWY